MCNLAGYSGKRKASINIIKLLALYGRERGTDGFGCWMGNELFKSGGYNKEGDSYNVLHGIVVNRSAGTSNTVLLHNRAKSVGWVNKDNAHPFLFDYIEGKKYVFAHNGTISNITELCTKYNIEQPTGSTDSYCLGKIIYEYGFDVLTEYKGFAALTVLDLNTDILYLWKGFSQCDSVTPSEERPLHIYNKKNMLYYSSEAITLTTALNTRKGIESLPTNVLLSVKEGNIIEGKKYDRSHIVFIPYSNYDWQAERTKNTYPNNSSLFDSRIDNAYTRANAIKKELSLYETEPNPQAKSKGNIYCYQGRYWKNGHMLKGAYMIEPDGKCYQVTQKEVELYKENNPTFMGKIKFFIEGYMLKNEHVYYDIVSHNKNENDIMAYDWAQFLHEGTVFFKKVGHRYSLYFNGHYTSNDVVVPLYSNYSYLCRNGHIIPTEIKDIKLISLNTLPETIDNHYGENFY